MLNGIDVSKHNETIDWQKVKGSDVLTADTTVQPSNIWIKGKIKAN